MQGFLEKVFGKEKKNQKNPSQFVFHLPTSLLSLEIESTSLKLLIA